MCLKHIFECIVSVSYGCRIAVSCMFIAVENNFLVVFLYIALIT